MTYFASASRCPHLSCDQRRNPGYQKRTRKSLGRWRQTTPPGSCPCPVEPPSLFPQTVSAAQTWTSCRQICTRNRPSHWSRGLPRSCSPPSLSRRQQLRTQRSPSLGPARSGMSRNSRTLRAPERQRTMRSSLDQDGSRVRPRSGRRPGKQINGWNMETLRVICYSGRKKCEKEKIMGECTKYLRDSPGKRRRVRSSTRRNLLVVTAVLSNAFLWQCKLPWRSRTFPVPT